MTAVELTDLWVNDLLDPSDRLRVAYWRDSTQGTTPDGEVRVYAGGRRRNVRGPGQAVVWTPALAPMTFDLAHDLESRAGRPCWFRDPFGGKILGVFPVALITHAGFMTTRRHGYAQHATVALTVTAVGGTEVPGA